MSKSTAKSNVESVRRIYDAFEMGDMDAIRAILDRDIELIEPEGVPIGGTYVGLDAVLNDLFPAVAERYPDNSVVPDRYVDDGDTVIALGTITGTAVETEATLESSFCHVFDFEDGRIVRWTSYFDTALFNAALEA